MSAPARLDLEKLVEMKLPPLSSSAMRVATLTQDVNASTRMIADMIGKDLALAARILSAANSPLYAQERSVTTLPFAVNALGNSAVHTLVMVYAASDAFNQSRRLPMEKSLWEHSLAVGLGARAVSSALGLRGGEEAFICGLLHDIGKLLLMRHNSEAYKQVCGATNEAETLERETMLFGYTHAQVGALVAKRWGLPEEISYVIYYHHQPSAAVQSMVMARVVDVADGLANHAGVGLRNEAERDLSTSESVIAFDLTPEQLAAIWTKVEHDLGEMVALAG